MTPEQEDTARHEAGHCAMALIVGLPVRAVGLDDHGGYCAYYAEPRTRRDAVKRILTTLGGVIESVHPSDLLQWPIRPHDAPAPYVHDCSTIARLIDAFHFTEPDYRTLLDVAVRLTLTAEYRQLVVAVSGLLDYAPQLDAAHIAAIDRRLTP
jgi:hypothetical protein